MLTPGAVVMDFVIIDSACALIGTMLRAPIRLATINFLIFTGLR